MTETKRHLDGASRIGRWGRGMHGGETGYPSPTKKGTCVRLWSWGESVLQYARSARCLVNGGLWVHRSAVRGNRRSNEPPRS